MKFLFTLLLASCGVALLAQKKGQALADSLDAQLPKMNDDSNKAKAINRIAQTYEGSNPMKAIAYAERGLQLSEKVNWKRGMAIFHNNLGLYISDTGNIALARIHLEKSLALSRELGNKNLEISNYINLGRTYQFQSDFTTAAAYQFKALAIAEETKNNAKIGSIAGNLASDYFQQNNFPKVTEYANMQLKYGMLVNNPREISKAYQQLSISMHMQRDTAGAISYLQKAIKICEDNNDQMGKADALLNLAEQYADYSKQIAIMQQVNAIVDSINPTSEIAVVNKGNLGNVYNQLAKQSKPPEKYIYLKKAEAFLLQSKALAEQHASPQFQAHAYFMLADLEENKSNYKASLDYYKRANSINDSLFSQDKKNEIAGLEGKHNIALKDNEIAINKLLLLNQRKTQLGLIAGLILLCIIGGLLYWQGRSRKRTNTTLMVLNNQLDEANKIKARFFGILSHDLRSPIVNLVHFLHLQQDDPDLLSADQQASHRQNISDSAEDLLNTMEAMLLWSKEQMENFRPSIKPVAVNDLFASIQKFVGQAEKISLRFNCEPGLTVSTDENYLRTIMQNLTSNAIRALNNTPQATIEWNARKEGNKTLLSITDNGPGIATEQAKALFDDNVADNGTTGFGLHLIRDLARAIQYTIEVQSEQGNGTTFILSNVAA